MTAKVNRSIAAHRNTIPYFKELRRFCGSVTASILFQQLEFRWDQKSGAELYKFLEPCSHPKCSPGDDWCTELGFSAEEFIAAFAKIGIRYTSKTSWKWAVENELEFVRSNGTLAYYSSYFDRNLGLTFYRRNDALANELAEKISSPETGKVGLPETESGGFQKPGKSVYGNRQSRFANKEADSTSDTTAHTTSRGKRKFTTFEDERAQVDRVFNWPN